MIFYEDDKVALEIIINRCVVHLLLFIISLWLLGAYQIRLRTIYNNLEVLERSLPTLTGFSRPPFEELHGYWYQEEHLDPRLSLYVDYFDVLRLIAPTSSMIQYYLLS